MICILVDHILSGYERHVLATKCMAVGLTPERYQIHTEVIPGCNVVVTLGEALLQATTGKKSIDKWHLSPLDSVPNLSCRRVVPTFSFARINKEWALGLYMEMALRRAKQNDEPGPWIRKEERYALVESADEAIARLETVPEAAWYSIDIETGRNQINTFGVAWSGSDALACKVLPDNISPAAFYHIWTLIRNICESDTPKVMSNGIYETLYFSRYGIRVNNFKHDDQVAMKFLWPELEKGLDNTGRIYTMEPYWKDDGRVQSEEGKQKDWGDIRDWTKHLTYNCRDTTNTLIGMGGQRRDLDARGLTALYDSYLVRLFDCVAEMCARGLPINYETQKRLIAEFEARSAGLVKQLSQEINPRSSKQKLNLLRSKGYDIPKKRKTGKESSDEISLKKLRLKHPDDRDIRVLLEIAGIEKSLSSYLRVRTPVPDGRIHFMLDPHGTETGRMSCTGDPWYGGLNAQTLTDEAKRMIEWQDPERVFLEFDLEQAETRFVAYDANEQTLLHMLETGKDVHRFVAAEIFQKPMAEITHDQRQLGKKSGHGANYDMGVTTFQESCLKELDVVLDTKTAKRVLESYHKLFQSIRRWHETIRNTVCSERRLRTPMGRERYFYGRADGATFREAYAYRPQSTIPDVTNHLMLKLCDARVENQFNFWLHNQVHDSLVLSAARRDAEKITRFALDIDKWHPRIDLPAGRLRIPTSAKIGRCLGAMEKMKL